MRPYERRYKNSKEFDEKLLSKMVGAEVPTEDFEKWIRKIFREKTSCKLWWSNMPTKVWDGEQWRPVNFRCCPSSHAAHYIFGLVLQRSPDIIKVMDGYLEAI